MTIDDTMQIFIDVLLAVKLRIHNILWHVKSQGEIERLKLELYETLVTTRCGGTTELSLCV